jgi:flagellar hook-length control protein FliK
VPQVASEANTYAMIHRRQPSARPPQAPDKAQGTPFDSLLDDGTQGPADRPSQPAPDDKAARADRAEPARSAGNDKGKDGDAAKTGDTPKSAKAKSAKSADAGDKTDKPASAAIAESDATTATDGKTADKTADKTTDKTTDTTAAQAASGADAKPAGDGKPADGVTPDAVAAALPVDPIPTITPADAIATVLAPVIAPDAAQQTAPAAEVHAAIVATPKAKPDALTALQADDDQSAADGKTADDAKFAGKTAPQLRTDGKPQASGDTDKDAVAPAGGEIPANSHRGAPAETPGPINADANAAAPKAVADAMPPVTLTAPSHNTGPADINPAAAPQLAPQAAAIPLAGVAFEITGKALAGKNHFEIRLDPPELGRIEVRLDVDRDGNVTSRMIADRSDTLDLLRRDAAGLERALQDAGLKTTDNSLQFSLRDHSTGQQQANGDPNPARLVVEDETPASINATPRDYGRLAGQGSGIDIHV